MDGVHHVELLPDPGTEAEVREQWRVLDEAGLPSLAQHRSPSNRPHVTLTMTDGWPPDDAAVRTALSPLPLVGRLGGLLVLGGRRLVLARAVVPSAALVGLQERVSGTLGPAATPHTGPGRWLPHVTLAHRLTPSQVGEALAVLAEAGAPPEREVRLTAARHWDAVRRMDEPLTR